jgi:hypothetical protein
VSTREVHLEHILGRRVFAGDGRAIGRIEEVRADRHGAGATVREYVIGPAGLVERLSAELLPFLGTRSGHVVRWDQLDLRDPERPLLRCALEELQQLPSR